MTIAVVVGMASEAAIIGERPGVIVIVGAGNASALTSRLEAAITAGADRVISVGICGGLNPALRVGDVALGEIVSGAARKNALKCDPEWAERIWNALAEEPSLSIDHAAFAWSATAVARLAAKALLRKATFADVVDEETWIAAKVAHAHGLPFAPLRVVSDAADFELPPAALVKLTASGAEDMGAILASVAGDIWQLPELIDLAGSTATAFANLRAALARVGPDFAAT